MRYARRRRWPVEPEPVTRATLSLVLLAVLALALWLLGPLVDGLTS